MKTYGVIVIFWIIEIVRAAVLPQINSMFKTRATKSLTNFSASPELISSIETGAKIAVEQCKETFEWDRWNCPESAFSKRLKPPFSKETAYVQAITAAGIVYAVTQSCAKGEISGCGCDPERSGTFNASLAFAGMAKMMMDKREVNTTGMKRVMNIEKDVDWVWGGCSHSTDFADKVARHILVSFEEGNDVQAYSMAHNNFVGRKIVADTMIKQCRCHGISGSCSVQTCWMRLAPFSEVAKALKQQYYNAIQVQFENAPYDVTMGNNTKIPIEKIQKTNSDQLLYLDESPDYCNPDELTGWPGTKGRPCLKSKTDPLGKKSCKNICKACGYKIRKQKKETSYRCNCAFNYCCEVTCDMCSKTVETYYCG